MSSSPTASAKDHRTKVEVGDVDRVLDGALAGPFLTGYLRMRRNGGIPVDSSASDDLEL